MTVIDADAQPPRVEASFTDAGGEDIRILDKEPIFCDGIGPDGIRCRLISGDLMGDPDSICVVSTDHPDSVEATDGRTVFEVRARQLARLPE